MPRIIIDGSSDTYFIHCLNEGEIFRIVTDEELNNDLFRLDGLNSVRNKVLPIPRRVCTDYFTDLYRDLHGCFVNVNGTEAFLDLDPLWETPDEWWRDAVRTLEPRTNAIRLQAENSERLRIILSIFRACFPEHAMLWGVRPDNDNVA